MSLGLSRQQELNLKEENQDRIRILKEGKNKSQSNHFEVVLLFT